MLEPSKPTPSIQMLWVRSSISVSSETGIEKCCQSPGRSLNLRSTILMSLALTKLKTFWASSGVMGIDSLSGGTSPTSILGLRRLYRLPARVTFLLNDLSSDSHVAALAGADADGVRHPPHGSLAVADVAGAGRVHADLNHHI